MAGTVADLQTKTFGKILGNVEVEAPADTSPDTLSQFVAKTEGDTVEDVKAYIDINTLNEVKANALVYTQAYKFPKVQTKSVADTLTRY